MRMLVVDDSAMVRELLAAILAELGHEAVCVADGVAALEAPSCDLVFLDLELPRRSGLEVAAELRARGLTVPIIAISGHADAEHRRLAAEAGIGSYVGKPFTLDEISDAIGGAFGIDMAAAGKALNRRADLLRGLVEDVVHEIPDLLAQARRAGEPSELRRAAHTIRGCLRFVDAPEAAQLAAELEAAAAAGRDGESLLAALEIALAKLIPRLRGYLRG